MHYAAQDLYDTARFSLGLDKQDPLLEISLVSSLEKKDAGVHAIFPETFDFHFNQHESVELEIQAFNSGGKTNKTKKLLIGIGRFPLSKITDSSRHEDSVTLFKQSVQRGRIKFTAILTNLHIDDKSRAYCIRLSEISAKNLPAANITTKTSDPYIEITAGSNHNDDIYRTEILTNNLNPRWKEECTLYTLDRNREIQFHIFDYNDILDDKLLSTLTFKLSDLITSPKVFKDIKLPVKTELFWGTGGSATLSFTCSISSVDSITAFEKSNTRLFFEDEFLTAANDALINKLYSKVLDSQLALPSQRETNIRELTFTQKTAEILQDKRNRAPVWGIKESTILNAIRGHDVDFLALVDLERVLVSANRNILQSFLDNGGVLVLLNILESKTNAPIDIIEAKVLLDVGIKTQVLVCLKRIIKTQIGMKSFLACIRSIETVALAIDFYYKPLSILVLDILWPCSLHSAASNSRVIHGLRTLSYLRQEKPFCCLGEAIATGDIEVKAAVIVLVNVIVVQSREDMKEHQQLRNDLLELQFARILSETLNSIGSDVQAINCILSGGDDSSGSSEVYSENLLDMIGYDGCLALPSLTGSHYKRKNTSVVTIEKLSSHSQSKFAAPTSVLQSSANTSSGFLSDLFSRRKSVDINQQHGNESDDSGDAEEGAYKLSSEDVDPSMGLMEGFLTYLKKDRFQRLTTKKRRFKLNKQRFLQYHGSRKNNAAKDGSESVSEIVRVDSVHSDNVMKGFNLSLFELEVQFDSKVLSFGCANEDDRNKWVTAFSFHLYENRLRKAERTRKLCVEAKKLSKETYFNKVDIFRDHLNSYFVTMLQFREFNITSRGVDWTNVKDVGNLLTAEALAGGYSENLLTVQKLLLRVPAEATVMWDAIALGLRHLLVQQSTIDSDDKNSAKLQAEKAFNNLSVADILQEMSEERKETVQLGTFAVRGEIEIEMLNDKVAKLQQAIQLLEQKYGVPVNERYVYEETVVANEVTEEDKFETYRKQLNMFPSKVIRKRMEDDGLNKEEIESFFSSVKDAQGTVVDKYAKYRNLRKHFKPQDLSLRMLSDGFKQAEINSFLAEKTEATVEKKGPDFDAAQEERSKRLDRLKSLLEALFLLPNQGANKMLSAFSERVSTYERIFNQQKEIAAVNRKMLDDRCSENEIKILSDFLRSKNSPPSLPTEITTELDLISIDEAGPESASSKRKMKTFFWKKLKATDIQTTFWASNQQHPYPLAEGIKGQLLEWFKKTEVVTEKVQSKQPKTILKSLLDPKRNRSLLIVLTKLGIRPKDLRILVENLNPTYLEFNLTQSLMDIRPTQAGYFFVAAISSMDVVNIDSKIFKLELDLTKGHEIDSLDLVGKYLWEFEKIPDVLKRLSMHYQCFAWFITAESLNEQLDRFDAACEEFGKAENELQALYSM